MSKQNNNENNVQQPQGDYENLLEMLDAESGATISGRVYRITSPVEQANGKLATELICKVDEPIDDDWIGMNFGPGRYRVRYRIKAPGVSCGEDRTFIYNVGPEYEKYKKPSNTKPSRDTETMVGSQSRGGFLENILSGLTPEKITAFGLGIKALKELFAPPPQPDYSKLFEIMAAQNRPVQTAPALSDTIVLSAMESLKQHNKQPTIFEQLRDLKRLKEELKEDIKEDENGENESGENMNLLIKTALEYLPSLLKQNNNNFKAVGAQAGEMPFVKNLVRSDPELAQVFFEKAREKYGIENAKNLAKGFGYNLDVIENNNENLNEVENAQDE